jgi:hypothetical protein
MPAPGACPERVHPPLFSKIDLSPDKRS